MVECLGRQVVLECPARYLDMESHQQRSHTYLVPGFPLVLYNSHGQQRCRGIHPEKVEYERVEHERVELERVELGCLIRA